MTTRFRRFVGIDWSGAKGQYQRGIAIAECGPDGACALIDPPSRRGWSRAAAADRLAIEPPGTLAGLDFAFSLPWPGEGPLPPHLPQPEDAFGLWDAIEAVCSDVPDLHSGPIYGPEGGWLAEYLFVSLARKPLWAGEHYRKDRFRLTERMISPPPASVFKIVGPQTVGPSSFTGMRMLTRLRARSRPVVTIWPFEREDPAGLAIVEVYPGYYKRRAMKALGSTSGTVDVLAFYGARLDGRGPADGHEWDALVAAAAMRHFASDPLAFAVVAPIVRREGWIFGVPLE